MPAEWPGAEIAEIATPLPPQGWPIGAESEPEDSSCLLKAVLFHQGCETVVLAVE